MITDWKEPMLCFSLNCDGTEGNKIKAKFRKPKKKQREKNDLKRKND